MTSLSVISRGAGASKVKTVKKPLLRIWATEKAQRGTRAFPSSPQERAAWATLERKPTFSLNSSSRRLAPVTAATLAAAPLPSPWQSTAKVS